MRKHYFARSNNSIKQYQKVIQQLDESLKKKRLPKEFSDLIDECENAGRKVEFAPPPGRSLVVTTFFTGKADPQRGIKYDKNNFEYIEDWYTSVLKNKLHGVIFYDDLSREIIQKYSIKSLVFIKCELGDYSLNDERFIVQYMYLSHYYDSIDYVLLTDGNDVKFNKNPFFLIQKFDEFQILLGRNRTKRIIHSDFNVERFRRYSQKHGVSFPSSFYFQPIYNAGITGGSLSVILYFCFLISKKFIEIDSKDNNNMLLFNWVVYDSFCPQVKTKVYFQILDIFRQEVVLFIRAKLRKYLPSIFTNLKVNHFCDSLGNTEIILTSDPYHNPFGSFNNSDRFYIIHK